jgi:hypothetical protein
MTQLRYGTQVAYSDTKSGVGTFSSTNTINSSRVRDIILDEQHPKFGQYGGWNSIGVIFIESAKNPIFSDEIPLVAAYPAFPNIKHYPLKNELVPIIYLTDVDATNNTTSIQAYYLPPINVWNSITHNGIPSSNITPESQNKSYQQVEAGSTNIISDQSTEINLGQTFNEDNVSKIHPLYPYEGDILYEGRFGNSIRLGSTVNNAKTVNPWSSVGNNGSPIFIIRNGQSDEPTPPFPVLNTGTWVPIVEDINNDKSSVYLTSTQQIPLFPASNLQDSYAKSIKPIDVSRYSENQIILNSGRLVFNANKDSIILGAEKSIHITSDTSVNIDGKSQIVLAAGKRLYLGGAEGSEGIQLQSVPLGNNLMANLKSLVVVLQQVGVGLAGSGIASLTTPAAVLQATCNDIIKQIDGNNMLSDKVKVTK